MSMLDTTALRAREEQKVIAALRALNNAKKGLQEAINATENCEREFRAVSEQVRRRLEAIELVEQMAEESGVLTPQSEGGQTAEALSRLLVATSSPAAKAVVRTTSRPLFPSLRRSKAAELSILA